MSEGGKSNTPKSIDVWTVTGRYEVEAFRRLEDAIEFVISKYDPGSGWPEMVYQDYDLYEIGDFAITGHSLT